MSYLVTFGIGMAIGGTAVIVAAVILAVITWFLNIFGIALWGPVRYW